MKSPTELTLVTGNPGKLKEWQQLLSPDYTITNLAIDLDEIQTIDTDAIVADKAKRAYEVAKVPVIVEDISVAIDKLNGLPGPLIKFFVQGLGEGALYKLVGEVENERASVSCSMAYYDGSRLVTAKGTITGTIVAPRVSEGFGFNKTFVIDGWTKTMGEMTANEKRGVNHRSLAINQLLKKLQQLS